MSTAQVAIICYHYIKREGPFSRIWGHDWELFLSHLDFFAQYCPPISPVQLRAALREGEPLPPRSILLTFDDGLREHAALIAPYLAQRGISAIFNVCSDVVLDRQTTISQTLHFGTALLGIRPFASLVETALRDHHPVEATRYQTYLADPMAAGTLDLNARLKHFFNRQIDYATGLAVMKRLWQEELVSRVPDIFEQVFMDRSDVRGLIDLGHEVGLHTATHRSLGPRTEIDELLEIEVIAAKKRLETGLDYRIRSFAYPFGSADDILSDSVAQGLFPSQHLDLVFTTFPGEIKVLSPSAIGRYLTQSSDEASLLKTKLWFYEVGNPH